MRLHRVPKHRTDIVFDGSTGMSNYSNKYRSIIQKNTSLCWRHVTVRMLGLAVVFGTSGCRSWPSSAPADVANLGTTVQAVADWNDVDASVEVGASNAEMAVESFGLNDDGERVYRLRTIRDEPVWVVTSRATGESREESAALHIAAKVGHFGNPEIERRLIRAIEKRLRELHGVATHPLPLE